MWLTYLSHRTDEWLISNKNHVTWSFVHDSTHTLSPKLEADGCSSETDEGLVLEENIDQEE